MKSARINTAHGTNNRTDNRAIDLGLNIGDATTSFNSSVFALNGITSNASMYVAANQDGATRTIGLSGSGSATFLNQFYLDGNATLTGGSGTATFSGISFANTGLVIVDQGKLALGGPASLSLPASLKFLWAPAADSVGTKRQWALAAGVGFVVCVGGATFAFFLGCSLVTAALGGAGA
jgi:hypothetical protein